MKGVISRMSSSIFTRPMAAPMNRPEPTGGVFMPMIRFTQNTTPKWIGSMP